MEVLGLEITGDHARLVFAALGTLLASAGFIAGRWTQHRQGVRFRHEDLVTSTMVIELYAIKRQPNGRDRLHIVTQGSALNIDDFFRSPNLVRHVQKAAGKHPGLLALPNLVAHRMMMDEGKDALTGLDIKANLDFLNGRATRDDLTLFGFAAYAERDHDANGLRDQVARLVLMVVSPDIVATFADPAYGDTLDVAHAGYRPRCKRLHDFAREWHYLQALQASARSAAVDKIWQITVRTSL